MGEMVIKLGDEELIKRISDLARVHRRTPEVEVEEILRSATFTMASASDKARRAREVASMAPPDRTRSDSTELLREDRER